MMNVRLACVLLSLLLAPGSPALAGPPEEMIAPPSFETTVEVNVVNVDVRVTDASGQPVRGLGKRDFDLYEDGKRVDISNFAAVERGLSGRAAADPGVAGKPPEPAAGGDEGTPAQTAEDAWTLVVYVDNFDIHPGSRTRALRQLRDFLDRQLAPGDRVMLVTYDQGLKVRLPFTSDSKAIGEALTAMEGLASYGAGIDLQRQQALREIMTIQEAAVINPKPNPCPLSIVGPARAFAHARRDEVLRTLGALTVLVNSLSGVPGRKALLHVSDGIPSVPGQEVVQFLAEICGGGAGTAGIGRQSAVNGNNNAPEAAGDVEEGERRHVPARALNLDPMAVY